MPEAEAVPARTVHFAVACLRSVMVARWRVLGHAPGAQPPEGVSTSPGNGRLGIGGFGGLGVCVARNLYRECGGMRFAGFVSRGSAP